MSHELRGADIPTAEKKGPCQVTVEAETSGFRMVGGEPTSRSRSLTAELGLREEREGAAVSSSASRGGPSRTRGKA